MVLDASTLYTDMTVVVSARHTRRISHMQVGARRIPCHRVVLCRESPVFAAAMANSSFGEGQTRELHITDPRANRANVSARNLPSTLQVMQFLLAFYNKWDAKMTALANDILYLACLYDAPKVAPLLCVPCAARR